MPDRLITAAATGLWLRRRLGLGADGHLTILRTQLSELATEITLPVTQLPQLRRLKNHF
jgi:hypothetical protein